MNIKQEVVGINTKVLLSTLWLFALLNVIFRDVHEIVKPEFLNQMLAGGNQPSEMLFLIGGIMIEIPIAMVLFSRLLNYRVNRWANIGAAVFMMISLAVNNTSPDLDDIFFALIEFAALHSSSGKPGIGPRQKRTPSKATNYQVTKRCPRMRFDSMKQTTKENQNEYQKKTNQKI